MIGVATSARKTTAWSRWLLLAAVLGACAGPRFGSLSSSTSSTDSVSPGEQSGTAHPEPVSPALPLASTDLPQSQSATTDAGANTDVPGTGASSTNESNATNAFDAGIPQGALDAGLNASGPDTTTQGSALLSSTAQGSALGTESAAPTGSGANSLNSVGSNSPSPSASNSGSPIAAAPCDPPNQGFANGQCYWVNPETLTWTAARSACQAHGDHFDLAVIRSAMENTNVLSIIPDGTWIGAKAEGNLTTWTWVSDSDPFFIVQNDVGVAQNGAFTAWVELPLIVSGPPQGCVRYTNLDGNWGWANLPCPTRLASVCQRLP